MKSEIQLDRCFALVLMGRCTLESHPCPFILLRADIDSTVPMVSRILRRHCYRSSAILYVPALSIMYGLYKWIKRSIRSCTPSCNCSLWAGQRHPGAKLMHLSAASLMLSAHPRPPPYPVV